MLRTRLLPLARTLSRTSTTRAFSTTLPACQSIPLSIQGRGTGTSQTISVSGKPYTFSTDTYTALGGQDLHPSPVSYSLASLGSCNQVTGSLVAKDHGIRLGEWNVTVDGVLPTAVLVGGEQGNANWESVKVTVRVKTDSEEGRFREFVKEVERRCPITQLFVRSGVRYESEWVNEKL